MSIFFFFPQKHLCKCVVKRFLASSRVKRGEGKAFNGAALACELCQ